MQDKAVTRRVALLRAMPIFADLAEKDIITLVDDLRLKEYVKDEIIFRQGDESREVYFVLKGKVRIYKISPSGNETSIAIFSTNDVIGELAALDQEPRSATAKAVTAVSLLAMSQERFLYTMQSVPRFGLGCRVCWRTNCAGPQLMPNQSRSLMQLAACCILSCFTTPVR